MAEKKKTATLKNYARNLAFAGIGAVALAGDEAGRLFDRLVERGEAVKKNKNSRYRRTVDGASGKVKAVTGKVEDGVKGTVSGMMHRAGVPTSEEIRGLIERVDRLSGKVEALNAAE